MRGNRRIGQQPTRRRSRRQRIVDRGILYAPDFVVNAGGVINIAVEADGYSLERAAAMVDRIYDNLTVVFETADAKASNPQIAALRFAQARIAEAGGRRIRHRSARSERSDVTLGLDRIIDHSALGLDNDDLVDLYRKMLISRRLDDKMWALNRQGRVPFVVSVSGHEATQVGIAAALDPSKDWSLPYYRDIAFNIGLGMSPSDVFMGVFAKACRSSHRRPPDAEPLVGTRPEPLHPLFGHRHPVSARRRRRLRVASAGTRRRRLRVDGGEGSTSEGDWHEAMNFAGIHKLPVVFLIQNNLYAISVPAA